MLTGESLPVARAVGCTRSRARINVGSPVRVRVTATGRRDGAVEHRCIAAPGPIRAAADHPRCRSDGEPFPGLRPGSRLRDLRDLVRHRARPRVLGDIGDVGRCMPLRLLSRHAGRDGECELRARPTGGPGDSSRRRRESHAGDAGGVRQDRDADERHDVGIALHGAGTLVRAGMPRDRSGARSWRRNIPLPVPSPPLRGIGSRLGTCRWCPEAASREWSGGSAIGSAPARSPRAFRPAG